MARYVGITELTAENLNLLVERIEVSDRTETGDGMQQTVKIYVIPPAAVTREEIAQIEDTFLEAGRKSEDCPRSNSGGAKL